MDQFSERKIKTPTDRMVENTLEEITDLKEQGARPERVLSVLKDLMERITKIIEHENFFLDSISDAPVKKAYKEVDSIPLTSPAKNIQILPDDSVITAERKELIRYSKAKTGEWVSELLYKSIDRIAAFHAIPDGRVFFTDGRRWLTFVEKSNNGNWVAGKPQMLEEVPVSHLRFLPEGRVVTVCSTGGVQIYTPGEASWRVEKLVGHSHKIDHLCTAVGIIITGNKQGDIGISQRKNGGEWESRAFNCSLSINGLHLCSDGSLCISSAEAGLSFCFDALDPVRNEAVTHLGISGTAACLKPVHDGRVFFSGANYIKALQKAEDGSYIQRHVASKIPEPLALQVLPDARVVSSGADAKIRFFDGELE